MLQLIKPDIEYKESFEEFLESFGNLEKLHGSGIHNREYKGIQDFLETIDKCQKGLDTRYNIPSSTYWLMQDQMVIGTLNLRHSLNEFLLKRGGHIGYSIHPNYSGRGYGKKILNLGLEKAKELNIHKVLLGCHDGNIASEKIILANGGVYENTIEGIKRYWINN